VLDPLLSHSVGEALTGHSSNESHPTEVGGRHYESEPTRTPQRYGLAITSASSLKQAHLGVWITAVDRILSSLPGDWSRIRLR
jgi:hypothetical protein